MVVDDQGKQSVSIRRSTGIRASLGRVSGYRWGSFFSTGWKSAGKVAIHGSWAFPPC